MISFSVSSERPHVGVRLEQRRIARGEQRQRVVSEPANHLIRAQREGSRGDADERAELGVLVVAERGVGALEIGALEQAVPGVLAIVANDDLLEQVEDDSLHSRTIGGSRQSMSRGVQIS